MVSPCHLYPFDSNASQLLASSTLSAHIPLLHTMSPLHTGDASLSSTSSCVVLLIHKQGGVPPSH